jgi:hypothetical protein
MERHLHTSPLLTGPEYFLGDWDVNAYFRGRGFNVLPLPSLGRLSVDLTDSYGVQVLPLGRTDHPQRGHDDGRPTSDPGSAARTPLAVPPEKVIVVRQLSRREEWVNVIQKTFYRSPPKGHYPTRLCVQRVFHDAVPPMIEVKVPAWRNPDEVVSLPIAVVPQVLHPGLEVGVDLVAWVNLEESDASLLNFVNTQVARDCHLTLALVDGIDEGKDQTVVKIVLPGWNPYVYLPISDQVFEPRSRADLRTGGKLKVWVNLNEPQFDGLLLFDFNSSDMPDDASMEPQPGANHYRTMIDVVEVCGTGSSAVAKVEVTGWGDGEPVSVSVSQWPWYLQPRVRRGTLFFAQVNLAAEDPDLLFFCDFELAPQPGDEDVAARFASLSHP